MEEFEISNAIIESYEIRNEYNCLTMWIFVKFGSCDHQGFGGFNLCNFGSTLSELKANIVGHFITRVMEVVGVNSLKDIVGKAIRVNRNNTQIYSIGNILTEDWFCPKEDFKDINKIKE